MPEQEQSEVEVHGPAGTSIRARGYDVITILVAVFLGVFTWALTQHITDTKESNKQIALAINELSMSQREMACILALPQDDRLKQLNQGENSFCKQLSRPPRGDLR